MIEFACANKLHNLPVFNDYLLLIIGIDPRPPAPDRKASELTSGVNSKASELTFPCCESRGALGDKLWVN